MNPYRDCCRESCPPFRVVSHARLPDTPLRSDTQALRLIASISLIQRKEKCPSRKEKSAFPQWFSSVYVRSLKDQARKSKEPRTEILEPRTQSKLICHSSTTFLPTRNNQLIEVTLQSYTESVQSYIAFFVILYRSSSQPIQLRRRTNIGSHHPLHTNGKTYTEERLPSHFPAHLSPIKEHAFQTP